MGWAAGLLPNPRACHRRSPLCRSHWRRGALKLAEEYGGLPHFQLPKAERALQAVRNAKIAADYATNRTAREIAAEYGLTEGQVERIVAALGVAAPPDRRQRALF